MLFRNLLLYRLTKEIDLSEETLGKALEQDQFSPLGSQEVKRIGWTSPFGKHGDALFHSVAGDLLIALKSEEKVLPAAVVKETLDEKVAELEESQSRKIGSKEKQRLKEEITLTLLPRAFSRSRTLRAAISPALGLVLVDTTSAGKAEELLSLLRTSLGSLPVVPVESQTAPAAEMTQWLKTGPLPNGLSLGDEAELRDPEEDGAILRCRRQDLSAEEIKMHLNNDKVVAALAVEWQERVQFVLGQDLSVKRLKYTDVVTEAMENDADGAAAQLDADFAMMMGELRTLIPAVMTLFGGHLERD